MDITSQPLLSVPNFVCDESAATGAGKRFPRGAGEPIEQRRVRLALISAHLAEIKASGVANSTLFGAKAVLRNGFSCGVSPFALHPAGVATFHSKQLGLTSTNHLFVLYIRYRGTELNKKGWQQEAVLDAKA